MLRIIAPGFLLGTYLFHQLSELPALWWSAAFLLPATVVLWRRHPISYFIAAVAIAFFWSHIQASLQLARPLPESLYGKDLRVRGYVAELPEDHGDKQDFIFDVAEVLQPAQTLRPQRIRLNWYHASGIEVRAGQEWILTIRIKPVRNYANPGAFDYSAWLFQKGIRFSGYINSHADSHLLGHNGLNYPLQQLREYLRTQLKRHLGQLHFEPVFRALLIGDRSDMSDDMWQLLQKTGTVHLMAISGLHIGIVAGFIFVCSRFLWARSNYLTLRLAAPRAAALISLSFAILYSALAGFSLPTQRALIMLAVYMGSVFFQRKTTWTDVLGLGLVLVLVRDTHAVLSISFWLSFIAVALIFYILQFLQDRGNSLKSWLHVQIGISIGLLPVTIYFFQQAPLISPIANLVAIPVVTFVILPLAMFALFVLLIHPQTAVMVFTVAEVAFEYLWQLLDELVQIPHANVSLAIPDQMLLFITMIGVLLVLLPSSFRIRHVALLLILPLLFKSAPRPNDGEARLTLLDVGQGLSAVLETRRHLMIFDTGARLNHHFDLGRAVLVPYLTQRGQSSVDTLIISHGDNDHIGGVHSLLTHLPARQILTSVPAKLSEHGGLRCEAGMQWTWDDVHIEILHPRRQDYDEPLKENDLSCVLQVRTHSRTFLLTGDIEAEAETRLVARFGKDLHSDILIVPHHGSKTSSTPRFIDNVHPQIALVPVGLYNRYRFPHDRIVQRYDDAGAKLYTTARHGALIYDSESGRLQTWRAQQRRFWNNRDVD